jgi:hypothetical protein
VLLQFLSLLIPLLTRSELFVGSFENVERTKKGGLVHQKGLQTDMAGITSDFFKPTHSFDSKSLHPILNILQQ